MLDIAIAGGGPAGAVAAILLARAGFRVGLATMPTAAERVEGLSPRIAAILRDNGLASAGVAAPSQRRAAWGAFRGDQNVEHIVTRRAFDAGLLAQARREGVRLVEGVISVVRPDAGTIRMADGRLLRAGLLFEARGRRAPRARAPKSDRAGWSGPETISIAGFLSAPPAAGRGSEIAAREEGWLWRARTGDGRHWLQVVGDAGAFRELRGARARVEHLWARVLGVDAATHPIPDAPVVSACALRLTTPELHPRCPRLGDAAVALDPLSGHGIFWAISSALMAPPIARAILDGRADLARDFYRDRVVETFWRQARIARDFYAAPGHDGAFWRARRSWPDGEPAHPVIDHPRLERRVLLRDSRLARGEVLVTAADPGGAAFVLGQEIAPILRALGGRPLPRLPAFHRDYLPELPAAVAAGLHGWLINRGLGNGLPARP